ncbi:hypothetical protein Tco_1178088 [Tanacetum coccineum]
MRTTLVLVPTRNQSWNVGSVARLVTSKGIAIVVKRTTQILVVQERGQRTNPKTKVDAIAWWIDFGATTHFVKIVARSVALEFSSGKTITLFNVLYVPKLRFGYYNNGMFMLNLNKVPDDSDSVYMSSSIVVKLSLWHAPLGHVHYKRMLDMSKDDLIPAIDEIRKNVLLDEALDKFRNYKTEDELQQSDLIKTLRTDRGGEYYDPVFF